MQFENIFYKTFDGRDIEFLMVNLGEEKGWRAYVLSDINYTAFSRSRSAKCSDVHRLFENDENMKTFIRRFLFMVRGSDNFNRDISYICWTARINSLKDMKTVAAAWSEITSFYIRHGGSFQDIQQKLSRVGIINM